MYRFKSVTNEELHDENYGMEGDFFVTINAENTHTQFSTIANGKASLTPAGKIVKELLLDIGKHFLNMNVEEYVIMPNHIHAIISLTVAPSETVIIPEVSRFEVAFGFMVGRPNPFLLKGSIFHAITWFKSSSLIELRRKGFNDFVWKSGYYDFTIENPTSYANIKNYIQFDPQNWKYDIDNPDNDFRPVIYPEQR